MTQKTQNIITTVIGAILTAIVAITTKLAPANIASIIAVISGAINEIVNLATEKYVEPNIDMSGITGTTTY